MELTIKWKQGALKNIYVQSFQLQVLQIAFNQYFGRLKILGLTQK